MASNKRKNDSMKKKTMLSGFVGSKEINDVATPPALYRFLNDTYNFDFDPCPLNCKEDNLKIEWGQRNFVNPPFNDVKSFVKKAIQEMEKGRLSIFLLPTRTNASYWHSLILPNCTGIRFFKGRIKFPGYSKGWACPVSIIEFDPNKKKIFEMQKHTDYQWAEFNLDVQPKKQDQNCITKYLKKM